MLYTYLLKMINETKKEIFRNGIVRLDDESKTEYGKPDRNEF